MTISLKKINIWKVLFVYLIFQPVLNTYINVSAINTLISYSDEIIAVVLAVLAVVKSMQQLTLLKFERIMLIALVIFELIGLISGFASKIQGVGPMLVDAFTCAKFFIYYLSARILTKGKLTEKYFFSLNNICKVFSVVLFVLALHDAFMTPWFPVADYRFFTESITLGFGHPEFLSRVCFSLILVLSYNYRYFKHNIYYIMMLTVVMFLTFRTKSIVCVFILFAMYIYFFKLRFKSLTPIALAGAAGVGYFGYDSFVFYYIEHDQCARALLTKDGLYLAKQYFPLGTGFGTFGSYIASAFYSKLYIFLGYYNMYGSGLDEIEGNALSDTFWPIVYTQTGIFGFVAFLVAIFSMIIYIVKSRKTDLYFFWIAMSLILYDLISTSASSAFFHPSSMVSYLFLGLITSIHEFPKKEEIQ